MKVSPHDPPEECLYIWKDFAITIQRAYLWIEAPPPACFLLLCVLAPTRSPPRHSITDQKARVEDQPTTQNVHNWRVFFSAVATFAAVTIIGHDSASIGETIALSSFRREFGLGRMPRTEVNFLSANIVSAYQTGCVPGALMGYPVGQPWGARRASCSPVSFFRRRCGGDAVQQLRPRSRPHIRRS